MGFSAIVWTRTDRQTVCSAVRQESEDQARLFQLLGSGEGRVVVLIPFVGTHFQPEGDVESEETQKHQLNFVFGGALDQIGC